VAKYSIPVSIETIACKTIGVIECDTLEEFNKKADDLWESQGWDSPSTNISNNFELNDWEISEVEEGELKYYLSE